MRETWAAAREEKRGVSLFWCLSRLAPSVTRVAIRVSRVLLDGLQKKERLLVVYTKDHWTRLKKVLGTIAFATARVVDTQCCCKRINDSLTERLTD